MVTTISSIQLSKSLSLFALLSEKPMQRFISIVLYSMTRKILRNKSFCYLSRFQMISSSWSTKNKTSTQMQMNEYLVLQFMQKMRKPYCKIILLHIVFNMYCDICFSFVKNISIPNLKLKLLFTVEIDIFDA